MKLKSLVFFGIVCYDDPWGKDGLGRDHIIPSVLTKVTAICPESSGSSCLFFSVPLDFNSSCSEQSIKTSSRLSLHTCNVNQYLCVSDGGDHFSGMVRL